MSDKTATASTSTKRGLDQIDDAQHMAVDTVLEKSPEDLEHDYSSWKWRREGHPHGQCNNKFSTIKNAYLHFFKTHNFQRQKRNMFVWYYLFDRKLAAGEKSRMEMKDEFDLQSEEVKKLEQPQKGPQNKIKVEKTGKRKDDNLLDKDPINVHCIFQFKKI